MKLIQAINMIICAAIFGCLVGAVLNTVAGIPNAQVRAGIVKTLPKALK